MSNFKMKGLDKLQKQLKTMEHAAKDLERGKEVSFEDLFTQSFMSKNTQFNSFDDLLKSGNFIVESQKDFEAIPDDEMDNHVVNTTNFANWKEMLDTAASEYAIKKLGF